MPLKVSIVTSGTDHPRIKRLDWATDNPMDKTNVSKQIMGSYTENECIVTLYFEDQDAFDNYRRKNAARIIRIGNMRESNSMVAVQTVETVDTIPE